MPVIIRGKIANGTPIFEINSKEYFVKNIWGGVEIDGMYKFPAYYPLGFPVFVDIRKLSPKSTFDDEALSHLKELNVAKKAIDNYLETWEELEINNMFSNNFLPYDHQKKGILHGLYSWRHFYIWEMGSGKTRTFVDAFRLMKKFNKANRCLITCPPVVIPTWIREINKCSGGELSVFEWQGLDSDIIRAEEHDIILMTYQRARLEIDRNKDFFNDVAIDVIACDESHYIGNWDSAQTKAVLYLANKAKRRYLLSGTAADNPQKLYPQLRLMSSALMPWDYAHFKKQYLIFAKDSRYLVMGYKGLQGLNQKVDVVASRVKKSECLDLPPMTITDINFHLGTLQKQKYNELVEDMISNSDNAGSLTIQNGAIRVMKLRQILSGFIKFSETTDICNDCHFMTYCIERRFKPYTKDCAIETTKPSGLTVREIENPKLDVFEQLVNQILDSDDSNKILCWASFEEELDDMERMCNKNKIPYLRLDGSTVKNIGYIEDTFQKDPKYRILLGQIKTGIGITLTAANYTIYYSLTFDVNEYRQSLDRNNRPGQTRNMTVYRLLAAEEYGTIDRHMAYILSFKEQLSLTLVEKIMCLKCKNRTACESAKILPFRKGCYYRSEISKPITKLTVVE